MKGILVCVFVLLKKHLKQNIYIFLQIVITLFVFLGFIARLQSIKASADIVNTFNKCDAYYFFPYRFVTDNNIVNKVLDNNDIHNVDVGKIYHIGVQTDNTTLGALGYDDTIIKFANIKLTQGIWFDMYNDSEYIPVISVGEVYKVNDIVLLKSENGDSCSAKIIGSISKYEHILSFDQCGSPSISNLSFFSSYPTTDLIIPYKSKQVKGLPDEFNIAENNGGTIVNGQILIPKDKFNGEVINEVFKNYGIICNVTNMAYNYTRDIRFDLTINGIVLLVFTLLTATGLGGNNGLQSRLNHKNYMVYYMLGLKRWKCLLVEILKSLSVVIAGFIAVVLLYLLTPLKNFLISDDLLINWLTFLLALIFVLVICCVASLTYVIKLGKGSLISNYKNKE